MIFARLFGSRSELRQVAALPLMRAPDGTSWLVGLATSRESRRWIIPKGWPESGMPPHVAAANEAREEAGLLGRMEERPIGHYSYRKRLHLLASVVCVVDVYVLHVTERLESWPEKAERSVAFVTIEEAAQRVEEEELADLFRRLPVLIEAA
ncbi:MAG: NUDIX domain-containing protein [Hyphomicrobiaceae bacterium]